MVVLGIGNPLMRDDGIGVQVAGALRDRLADKHVKVVIGETDVAYCLDCICAADFVAVLDAARMGAEPGSVGLLPLQKADSGCKKPFAMHDINVLDAMAAEYPAIKGCLIGIEPADAGLGLDLSAPLQNRFEWICAEAERLIVSIRQKIDGALEQA